MAVLNLPTGADTGSVPTIMAMYELDEVGCATVAWRQARTRGSVPTIMAMYELDEVGCATGAWRQARTATAALISSFLSTAPNNSTRTGARFRRSSIDLVTFVYGDEHSTAARHGPVETTGLD